MNFLLDFAGGISSVAIICVSTGLLVYWISRAMLLLSADRARLEQILEDDAHWVRHLWTALWSLGVSAGSYA